MRRSAFLVRGKTKSARLLEQLLFRLMPCFVQTDFENELVIVIGKTCKDVSVDQALDYVLGYTLCNDVTVNLRFHSFRDFMKLTAANDYRLAIRCDRGSSGVWARTWIPGRPHFLRGRLDI